MSCQFLFVIVPKRIVQLYKLSKNSEQESHFWLKLGYLKQ